MMGGVLLWALCTLATILSAIVLVPFDPDVVDGNAVEDRYYEWYENNEVASSKVLSEKGQWRVVSVGDHVRRDVWIPCGENPHDEIMCHAWLHTRNEHDRALRRVVILGHGLGAQKDHGLHVYATALLEGRDPSGATVLTTGAAVEGGGAPTSFAADAVLLFDYRSYGGSDGVPRHNVDAREQVRDWHSVLDHLHRSNGLDGLLDVSDGVVLWGTSYAGGHVVTVAAERAERCDPCVAGIVSQVPSLSGKEAMMRARATRPFLVTLRMSLAVVRDVIRSALALPPARMRVISAGDHLSFLSVSREEVEEYFSKHPEEYLGGWTNWHCARLGARLPFYNPIESVTRVHADVLFIAAARDDICPREAIENAFTLTHSGDTAPSYALKDLLVVDQTHFGVYSGQGLVTCLERMLPFVSGVFERAAARRENV